MTTTGPYAPGRYFIRLSRTGDPNAAITYNLGNGSIDADQRAVIDQGFLELTRVGALSANDPDVKQSLAVVDSVIRKRQRLLPLRHQRRGHRGRLRRLPCARPDQLRPRGQAVAGRGRQPRLRSHLAGALRRARRATAADRRRTGAAALYDAMSAFAWGVGLMPEQNWENPPLAASPFGSDPTTASIGFFTNEAAGSATPLTWAQAQHARLALSLDEGRPLEQPAAVRDRYRPRPARRRSPSPPRLTARPSLRHHPRDRHHGAAGAGRRRRHEHRHGRADRDRRRHRAQHRRLRRDRPDHVRHDRDHHHRDHEHRDRVRPASRRLGGHRRHDGVRHHRPGGRRQRPGHVHATRPAGDFHAGAFDLTRFQVIDGGDTIYLRTTLRDLTPTFGTRSARSC